MRDMVTFIVSVFDRPESLNACLGTLRLQSSDITVADNSPTEEISRRIRDVCWAHDTLHVRTGQIGRTCYDSAEIVVENATNSSRWLCFPSDDSLYVAGFSEIMLATAESENADLVYCDCLYRSEREGWPPYTVLNTQPKMCHIDKTCFIVRKSLFHGFPEHPKDYRDGALIESLVKSGVRHAKAPGVLVVHQ